MRTARASERRGSSVTFGKNPPSTMSPEYSKMVDSYCDLAKLLSEEYRSRRTLEWQIHIALWTVLAGIVYLSVTKDIHIGGGAAFFLGFAFIFHVIWTIKIVRGQIREQDLSRYYRSCAVALLRGASVAELPPPPKEEEGSAMPKWLTESFKAYHWWLVVQFGTTLIIGAVAFWLLMKGAG